jgi:hypothetical protein
MRIAAAGALGRKAAATSALPPISIRWEAGNFINTFTG